MNKSFLKADFKKLLGYKADNTTVQKIESKEKNRKDAEKERSEKEIPLFSIPIIRAKKYEFY